MADARLSEAIIDRMRGKPMVVLLAGEALLLGGRDNPAILNQTGRAVVVIGGNPENLNCGSSVTSGRQPRARPTVLK